MTIKLKHPIISPDEIRDLGFGSVVAGESRQRLLNRDGSFNVGREGLSFWTSLSLYHMLLTMSWPKFLSLMTLYYVLINLLFTFAFMLCGAGALSAPDTEPYGQMFWRALFFSIDTFATIGYGNISPVGYASNLIVTLEALVGIISVALLTGVIFARFSRPTAKILFSERAVVAPYRGVMAFEFRLTNARTNQIIELGAKVMLARFEDNNGKSVRRFYPLTLEREKVAFLPLSWTIVHPIDEQSVLYGLTHEDLLRTGAEFLILLTGIDETFSQTVHARSSYTADEVVWNARFKDIYNRATDSESLTIDVRRLHLIEPLPD
jgi:Inward rectifier potassium channel.